MSEVVKIYSLPTCPVCKATKEFLSQKGIEYIDYDVGSDKGKFNEMREISGGARSVPVLVICDDVYVGFDKEVIEKALECIGKQDK